ncbi:MAG: apolipoprotein N-acyltransferase, partial [Desulfovibrionaceae bacterium]|nr:apolipoprotein N-acyltransferase [Desulfovibrionaceae bacterium]
MTACVAISALGAWLGFANPYLQVPAAALFLPLGLCLIGFRAESAKTAFMTGWLAGWLACLGCLYWVAFPVQHYGGLNWLLAAPCPALMCLVLGAYHGLFCLAMHLAARKRLAPALICLFAAATWTFMEMLSATLFSGFPWLSLSSSLAPWPVAVQAASLVGAFGLSGLMAGLACAMCLWRRSNLVKVLAAGLAAGLLCFGWLRMNGWPQPGPDARGRLLDVALVQGDIDQSLKWKRSYQSATVDKYLGLGRRAVTELDSEPSGAPRLMIWPETCLPFYFQDDTELRLRLTDFARENRLALVLGSPGYSLDTRDNSVALHNRAYLLDGLGLISGWYDKEHLVPFGEYAPLKDFLPIGKLVEDIGDFRPGRAQRPLDMGAGARLGMLICYEVIFPDLAQERVRSGAGLLVSISNDAWFGETSAPLQHLSLSIMRAVEQGRWLARATNTGISALVDPLGRVTARSGLFEARVLTGKVRSTMDKTAFNHIFDVFKWVIYALVLLFAGILALRR